MTLQPRFESERQSSLPSIHKGHSPYVNGRRTLRRLTGNQCAFRGPLQVDGQGGNTCTELLQTVCVILYYDDSTRLFWQFCVFIPAARCLFPLPLPLSTDQRQSRQSSGPEKSLSLCSKDGNISAFKFTLASIL